MKARLTPEADHDAQQAIRWYDERDSELGDDFLRKVNDCITSIEENPQQFPVVHRQMRRTLVRRWKTELGDYSVDLDKVRIIAPVHTNGKSAVR